ncbi:MAG: AMP-binding protein [Lentisphaeraceae bacterium]|nr:AMP-binding protein [Lentisphaeraceae bacterium]
MKNLYELLQQATKLYGQKVFLDCSTGTDFEKITYSQFAEKVEEQAQSLKNHGVKEGDRVAFLTPKSPEQAYLFYAVWRLNAIAVPVSESMGDGEVSFIIDDADPSLIVLHESLKDREDQLSGDRKTVSFADLKSTDKTELAACTLEADTTAVLIYTSGSTGKPKGVMLSHRNLMVNARSAGDCLALEGGERILSLLPYWHSFALIAELVMMLYIGGTTIFPKDRRDFAKNLARFNATFMLAVPRMLQQFKLMLEKECEKLGATATLNACLENAKQLYKENGTLTQDLAVRAQRDVFKAQFLSNLKKAFGPGFKYFIGGGAPLSPDLHQFYNDLDLSVLQGYGLTETSPVISCNTVESNCVGSSGKIISWLLPENGGDYTFIDSEGNRSKDVEGELLVKGDSVMQGYWGHKDASAKSIQDGWLHTGDVACLKNDYLFITGRASNLIVLKGGEKVHPEHVEDIVKKCELVSEVMLVGEKCKNVYAVVNVEENELDDVTAVVKKQMAEAIKDLAPFQKPKNVLVLPTFSTDDGTLTPTLKIRRKNVWSTYGEQLNEFLLANGEEIDQEK